VLAAPVAGPAGATMVSAGRGRPINAMVLVTSISAPNTSL
jgi:hypothetical protein